MVERKVVIPGEVVVSGEDYLPGDGTEKKGNDIIAQRFGLAEEGGNLIRIIPLGGTYNPRRGNIVIGRVEILTHNGWVIDFGSAENGFLPITEVPRYVNKGHLDEVMEIGDMVIAKISYINGKSIDLTIRSRGLGKIEEGIIFKINPNKVPRVIGKEGSMIKMIKEETGCNIQVGQNGFILIKGDTIEDELLAKKAILFINENTFIEGLTEKVEQWFVENGGRGHSKQEEENVEENETEDRE